MILRLIVCVLVAICVFIVARFGIIYVFSLIRVTIPTDVAAALALLIAIGAVFGGYRYYSARI